MRNIFALVFVVVSSSAFASTLKIVDTTVTLDPNNAKSNAYVDQRFILNAKELGMINPNVCHFLPQDYFQPEAEKIRSLEMAAEKKLSVEVEVSFSGKEIGKDACVSSVKLLIK